MPTFHPKTPSLSPSRPSTTRQALPSLGDEMQLKGVKRIVSGLKRRISRVSFHRHRRGSSSDSDPDALLPSLLDVVRADGPAPITLPISPRTQHSVDTLARSADARKHLSSDDEESDSAQHSRSSTSASDSFHEVHSHPERSAEAHPGSSSHTLPSHED